MAAGKGQPPSVMRMAGGVGTHAVQGAVADGDLAVVPGEQVEPAGGDGDGHPDCRTAPPGTTGTGTAGSHSTTTGTHRVPDGATGAARERGDRRPEPAHTRFTCLRPNRPSGRNNSTARIRMNAGASVIFSNQSHVLGQDRGQDPDDEPADHGPDQDVEPAQRDGGEPEDERELHEVGPEPQAGGGEHPGDGAHGRGQAPAQHQHGGARARRPATRTRSWRPPPAWPGPAACAGTAGRTG